MKKYVIGVKRNETFVPLKEVNNLRAATLIAKRLQEKTNEEVRIRKRA